MSATSAQQLPKNGCRRFFSSVFLLNHWMFSFAAICLFELLNPFIVLSFGEKYLFTTDIVWILCINFLYPGAYPFLPDFFRNSLGLFWYDRYKSIAEALINLIVSIILAQRFGTFGVFMGTLSAPLPQHSGLNRLFYISITSRHRYFRITADFCSTVSNVALYG